MRKTAIFALLFVFFIFYHSVSQAVPSCVRIRILNQQPSVEIWGSETITIASLDTKEYAGILLPGVKYLFEAHPSAIRVLRTSGETAVFLFELPSEVKMGSSDSCSISVKGRRYRGDVFVKSTGSGQARLDAINVLSIEDYIRGTIRCEISPSWPREAIKAHVVAARTYALRQIQNTSGRDFDMEASVLSQVYWGVEGEDGSSDQLIKETSGEYVNYKGDIAQIFYHSCCGGYSEDSMDVWGFSVPYLAGKRCPFCRGNPNYSWEKKYKLSGIEASLRKGGIDLGRLIHVWAKSKNRTGRITELGLKGERGQKYIKGEEFRRLMGYSVIPSTMFTIYQRYSDELIFRGRGWGHGVGMCQWGARGMALLGYTYTEILKFYYPGIKIQVIDYDRENTGLQE